MNRKHLVLLSALLVVSIAAIAWAAEAPASPPAPEGRGLAAAPHADGAVAVLADDEDDEWSQLALDEAEDAPPPGGGPGMGMGAGRNHGGWQGGPGMPGGRAGMGFAGRSGRGPGMRAMMAARLELTDAQRERLADIHDRQLRKGIQSRADLAIARLDLRKAMRSENPEASAINTQIDHVARIRTDLAKARVASMLEARSVLTPEQLKKLRQMRMHTAAAGDGMGDGARHAGGMGPGGMGMRGMGPGPGQVRVRKRIVRDSTGTGSEQ